MIIFSYFLTLLPIMVFAPEQLHINDLELLSTVPSTEFWRASFPCSKKHVISNILRILYDFYNLWANVPWGPCGPIFRFFENL